MQAHGALGRFSKWFVKLAINQNQGVGEKMGDCGRFLNQESTCPSVTVIERETEGDRERDRERENERTRERERERW